MSNAPYPKYKAWKANGISPAVGYYLYTYSTGTTIPKATYNNADLLPAHANTNPIILDSNGEADIFLDSGSYRFDLKSPLGALVNTFDPIASSLPSVNTIPRWTKVTIPFTSFAKAGLSNLDTVIAYTLPLLGVIQAVKCRVLTPFTGGGISAYTIAIGVAGLQEDLTPYYDVFTAPGVNSCQLIPVLATYAQTGIATSIFANAICVGANLDQANAGSLELELLVSIPS